MKKRKYVKPMIEVIITEGMQLMAGSGSGNSSSWKEGNGTSTEISGPESGGDGNPNNMLNAPRRRFFDDEE